MQVPEGVHSSTMYLNDTRLTQMQRPGRQTCHPKPCRLKSDEPIQRVQPTPLLAGDVDRQQGMQLSELHNSQRRNSMDNLILEWLKSSDANELRNGNGDYLYVDSLGQFVVRIQADHHFHGFTDLTAALAALAGE